jgi:hypothetical protein
MRVIIDPPLVATAMITRMSFDDAPGMIYAERIDTISATGNVAYIETSWGMKSVSAKSVIEIKNHTSPTAPAETLVVTQNVSAPGLTIDGGGQAYDVYRTDEKDRTRRLHRHLAGKPESEFSVITWEYNAQDRLQTSTVTDPSGLHTWEYGVLPDGSWGVVQHTSPPPPPPPPGQQVSAQASFFDQVGGWVSTTWNGTVSVFTDSVTNIVNVTQDPFKVIAPLVQGGQALTVYAGW